MTIDNDVRNILYNRLLKRSMIPDEFIDLKLTKEHQKLVGILTKDFKPFGKNKFYLYSDGVGTGKTTIATYMLQKLLGMEKTILRDWHTYKSDNSYGDTVWVSCPAYFVNIRNYLYLKKRSFNDKELCNKVNIMEDCMLNSQFLVVDELGAIGSLSDYDTNLLYVMLDERNNKSVTTIFTSNMTPNQLNDSLSGSLVRRILQDAYFLEVQ